MLLSRARNVRALLVCGDALVAALSMLLTIWLCQSLGISTLAGAEAAKPDDAWRLCALALMYACPALHGFRAYSGPLRHLSQQDGLLLKATLVGAGLIVAGSVLFRVPRPGAELLGIFVTIQLVALVAHRAALSALLSARWKRGGSAGTFITVGSGPMAQRLADRIAESGCWGLRNVGFLDDDPSRKDVRRLGDRFMGATKELPRLLSEQVIDEVVVALPARELGSESIVELVEICEALGVDVTITADLFQTARARPRTHDLLADPGITLANYSHRSPWRLATKRAIDLVGAAIGLLMLSPILLAIAMAIRLDSRGPIFFAQRRSGLRGRTFPFLKFRTMHRDAEARLESLRERNELTGPVFKIKDDPRVTRVGRVLRKTSMDELPQLLNVLAGHMSLVGPRPPIPGEVNRYQLSQRRRLSVRPGLTCLWQVQGRNLIPFEDWVRLDLEYIDSWSLWLDLRILLRTIPAVLSGRGAS